LELFGSLLPLFGVMCIWTPCLFIFGNLGTLGAEESSQKIENNYGNSDHYLNTGVHARLILKYLLGIAM
jgi:hypothetical protein